ncbi:MAG: Sec-independent protein translocase subunit TatA/TatB [Petrimonas sp.]|jgi:sec-independent protein translocase protein TatA|nr:MAG: twin arginine translocase protein A [Bacteroidetes bacterium ADurb.BinA174]
MNPLLFNLNGWEIPIIVLVILILFGGKKIPEFMKGLGKGINSFKRGLNDIEEDIKADPSDKKSSTTSNQ